MPTPFNFAHAMGRRTALPKHTFFSYSYTLDGSIVRESHDEAADSRLFLVGPGAEVGPAETVEEGRSAAALMIVRAYEDALNALHPDDDAGRESYRKRLRSVRTIAGLPRLGLAPQRE